MNLISDFQEFNPSAAKKDSERPISGNFSKYSCRQEVDLAMTGSRSNGQRWKMLNWFSVSKQVQENIKNSAGESFLFTKTHPS